MKKYSYILKNLDCANCANKIQNEIASQKEFHNVIVNFSTLRLSFESDSNEVHSKIIKIVKKIEPEVEVLEKNQEIIERKNYAIHRLIIGLFIIIISQLVSMSYLKESLIILAYGILLYRTIKNALKIMKNSKSIDENFLVTISCIGAYLVGEHMEGLMVIILYEIGKILEEKAVNNTRKSIKDLMDIRPQYANLKKQDKQTKVEPEILNIDDIIIVKAGEKVPIDGIVLTGKAELDTSALTGESDTIIVEKDSKVLSGSINVSGLIEVKVTCEYENSTVNKILQLVENATDNKAKTETFVSKASRIYTPLVLALAISVAIFLPVFTNLTYQESIYRSLIFLVISCPCAIAISVPLSYFSGIGKASKLGILVKGSNYLDNLQDIKTIIFDKTGTITTGSFEVKEIISYDSKYSENEILDLFAKGESFSNHPIAKSILKRAGTTDIKKVSAYEEIAGKGIKYQYNNKQIKIGNQEFTNAIEKENSSYTTIYLNYDGKVIGSITIDDGIKEGALATINNLKKMHIKTAMFTGDNQKVAKSIAQKLGIDEIKAELLPTDKYNELEKILKKTLTGKVAFVGDGINDAPVLARSDIGFSMGNVGSSSAIEASDVVIMTDELDKIVTAIRLSKYTRNIIKQNLIFAVSTKTIILLLSVIGIAGMWQAIFADVGVTLITILNTTRILKKKTV